MATRRPSPYRDNFELETLESQPGGPDDPDSPLPNIEDLPDSQKPRWGRDAASSRTDEILSFLVKLLRPRFTWRYILCFIVGLYLFYCIAESSPLLASKLPQYTGPHGVGTIDLEIPLDKPRLISETRFKKSGHPAYELETVLFSLYYPARRDARERRRKHYWVAKPVSVTAKGYAKFAHVDNFLMRGIFTFGLWAIGGSIKIPALVDVPLLHYNEESEDHEKEEQDAAFPIVVFSHGTASSRTDYTQLCGELASRGVVCAAIEHRDGSGPGTVIHSPWAKKKERYFYYEKELDTDPPADTDTLKKNQLDFRQAEIEETITILERINTGEGAAMLEKNTFAEGKYLAAFESRLNTSHIIIAGHSYGATGALQAVKSAPSRKKQAAVGVIAFDPGKSSGRLNTDVSIPTLVVHSNSWSSKHSIFYGRPHFDTVKELVDGVLEKTGAAWFMTMLGTSHPSVTDAPLIEPLLLSWTTGSSINVLDGLREYVGVVMEFVAFLGNGTRGRLLGEGVTHPTYGQDERSDEQKRQQDKSLEKFWQIHVSPPAVVEEL